jgi:hypothetical protein
MTMPCDSSASVGGQIADRFIETGAEYVWDRDTPCLFTKRYANKEFEYFRKEHNALRSSTIARLAVLAKGERTMLCMPSALPGSPVDVTQSHPQCTH